MLVVGLSFSERKNGNSDRLLSMALEAGQEAGAQTRRLEVRDYQIGPCRNCEGCLKTSLKTSLKTGLKTGACIFTDDGFHTLLGAIFLADRLVIATPVYFMGLPARSKALVDRCQSLWNQKYRLKRPRPQKPGAKALVIMVGGANIPDMFTGLHLTLRAFFDVIGFDYWKELTYPGIDIPEEFGPPITDQVKKAGRLLVLSEESR